ncbi:uncharacterized protein [Montipora capricornis]|uniref:uncharacterized protein isoform X2 n=1 Tax=Montipora capricornis TaxID=246305 RepID=UPI0035F1B392
MNGNPLLNALPTTINEDKIPDGHGFQSDYKVETGAGNIQRIDNVLDYTAAEFEVDGSQFGNPNGNVQSIYFGTNFAAQIVYKRPDNPFQFLIEELEKSQEEKASDCGSEECN